MLVHAMTDFGVYVHVPFCQRRCDYCDFATWTDRFHLVERYVDACVTDIRRRAAAAPLPLATSVFFGGGTPSLLPPSLLARVLDAIPRASGAEVTVECNPDTVDHDKLAGYRDAGVTRVSFGVQSMVDHVLASLGRTHDPASVERAVELARDVGFASFNLDIIYGAAGESVADWRTTLEHVLAFDPPHISAYALTVEPATPLATRIHAGEVAAPDDDDQATKYAIADDAFGHAGLQWYEISNWARPGHACRHNQLYWQQGDYLAIGCAAHGHTDGRRWWTVRTPERYIDRIVGGQSPEAGCEQLADAERASEAVALALRTRAGAVVADDRGLVADGLATWHGSHPSHDSSGPARLVLTRRGRLLANEATTRLL